MAIPIFQRTIVNESGDILAGATVTVTNSSTGLPATIYADRSGTALSNPFTSDSNGLATFYADPDEYDVSATDGTATIEWLNFAMTGTAALSDSGTGADEIPKNSDLGTASLSDVMVDGYDTEEGKVLTVGATVSQLDKTNSNIKYETTAATTLKSDFANNKHYLYKGFDDVTSGDVTVGDIWTHTRATSGTGISGNLSLQAASVDVPRMVFDPDTGDGFGYKAEGSRTRINTISELPTLAENMTVTEQEYTVSFYGEGTITLSGAYSGTLVGVSSDERVYLTFTASAGILTSTPSGTVKNLQIEAGAFATSVILGEGSTVTRAEDSMIRTLGEEWNANEGTLIIEFDNLENVSFLLTVGIDASTYTAIILTPNGEAYLETKSNNDLSLQIFTGFYPIGKKTKMALSITGTSVYLSVNGGDVLSGTQSIDVDLSEYSKLLVGKSFFGVDPTVNVQYIEYINKSLSDFELQEKSTL